MHRRDEQVAAVQVLVVDGPGPAVTLEMQGQRALDGQAGGDRFRRKGLQVGTSEV